MGKYITKRLILTIFTTIIILSLSFFLIHLLPFQKPLGTDPGRYSYYMKQVYLGYVIESGKELPELGAYLDRITINGVTHYFYEVPITEQYFLWVKNIVTKFDWGVSTYIMPNNSAFEIILSKLKPTVLINLFSTLFAVPIGIGLGIWAALKKNSATDYTISTLIMVFISVPSFIIITLLMFIFCYTTKLLPTQWPTQTDLAINQFKGFILPVVSLSFGSICGYARFTRAELCEVMSSDYILLARTKGLTRNQAIVRHALRNAMVPIVPAILAEVIGLLSGSMILEKLYGIPGTGSLYVEAINAQDYPVLFVDMALYTVIGLVASVFLDISYGLIDPRIRMGAKK